MSEDLKEFCLLPCPHCGSEDLSVEVDTANFPTVVLCCNCLADIRSGDPVLAWNTRSIPELPPVSPEALVEGEWYVYNAYQKFVPMVGKAEKIKEKFVMRDPLSGAIGAWASCCDQIYGPLKFKIGGAE